MNNSIYKRGIDITISILKKEYPFILGWKYHKDNDYRSSIYIDIVVDMKKASEFYGSPIKPYYMNIDSDTDAAYPFSVLEMNSEHNSDEKYDLYKNIVVDLDGIYEEIPDDYKDKFESGASNLMLTKDLYIESFIFEKPNKSITESKQKSNYLNMIKNFVESYKDRDFVCDIEVLYDEKDDYYVVTLWFDPNEMSKRDGRYISDLRLELTRDVKKYIPLPNVYVGSGGEKGCSEKNINESMSDKNKINLVKKIIYDFDGVSFIKQSTYNDRPLLTVYFNSDDTAANIESYFTHEICDTVKDYTGGEILCNPRWGPEWKTNKNNPDILIDSILLRYDDGGNVLNESKEKSNKNSKDNLIKNLILPQYEHIMCDIEYKEGELIDMAGNQVFSDPNVTVTFISGKGTRMFIDDVLNEVWDMIYDYTGISVELYSKYVKDCGKENINENWHKVPSSEYNSIGKLINRAMKDEYDWWKDIKINTLNYIEKHGVVQIEAELTVDEEWGANQWREFHPISEFPGNKGWEDDGYELVRFGDIIDSTYAEVIIDDLREILKYTLNIDAYIMSFRNIYLIFE